MVRLLPSSDSFADAVKHHFQSHNGAIAAELSDKPDEDDGDFQSHNGAIAATPEHCALSNLMNLSIPQWCDCCHPSPHPRIG